ncbi:MAG: hypothetical protein O7G86_10945 [Gammaproteobacteria bacterium]|nr:hypothetical protein [Gammaproteobacteria bacterium]
MPYPDGRLPTGLAGRSVLPGPFFAVPHTTTLSGMNWRIFLWPLNPTGVLLILVYAVIGWGFLFFIDFYGAIEPLSRWLTIGFSLPGWYLIAASLALYSQKMLTHVARGLLGEPMQQETNVNPFQSFMALKLGILMAVVFAVVLAIGETPTFARAVIPALIFPLFWLGVMIEESLLTGFHYLRLARLLGGLGYTYPLVAALLSGSVGYMAYLVVWKHSFPAMFVSAYCFLLANAITGAVLHWRRAELNLDTDHHVERVRMKEWQADSVKFGQLFHELDRHCANGNLGAAFEMLQSFMGESTEELDPLMHERLRGFRDVRLSLLHAVHYLQRMVDRGENRKAWALLKSCVEIDDRFRPLTDSSLLALTRATGPEDAGLVNVLLEDFQTCYPDSEHIASAKFRRARVCLELLSDRKTGTALIEEIASNYPEFAATDRFVRYQARLRSG